MSTLINKRLLTNVETLALFFFIKNMQNTFVRKQKNMPVKKKNHKLHLRKHIISFFLTSGLLSKVYITIILRNFTMQIHNNSTRSFPCKCLQMHNQAEKIKNMLGLLPRPRRNVCLDRFLHHLGNECLVLQQIA